MGSDDYRNFLKNELDRRVLRNNSYSLRSFARDLGIPVSKLSEMLNRRQGLSRPYAKKIIPHLKLSPLQEKLFMALVELELSRTPAQKAMATAAVHALRFDAGVKLLDPNKVEKLDSPFHFAVKCFLEIDRTAEQEKNIATRFGFSAKQVKNILKDLEQSQQIQKVDQIWEIVGEGATRYLITPETEKDRRLKLLKYRKACYEMILNKLELEIAQDGESESAMRLLSDVVLTVPSSEMPKLKEMLNQMKSNLLNYCEHHPAVDEVYFMSLSFFPLSKKKNRGK